MTLYTGEPVVIEITGKDFHPERPLAQDDLSRVSVRVTGPSSNTEVLEETDAEWVGAVSAWQLAWVTPDAGGTYLVEIQAYGLEEDPEVEPIPTPAYKRLRVANRPYDDADSSPVL